VSKGLREYSYGTGRNPIRPDGGWLSVECSERSNKKEEEIMAWTTPMLVEICVGLEINGYLPAEF
jgi:coenzyme PQQ precursor peptide PqqA